MSQSIFTDRAAPPSERELAQALGETKELWDQMKTYVRECFYDVVEEWKHYGKNSGWTMKLLKGKRNLFFSYPGKGCYMVAFIFGEGAFEAVSQSSLPKKIIEDLQQTRKYAEGRGLQVTVKNADDLEHVKTLIAIKVEH